MAIIALLDKSCPNWDGWPQIDQIRWADQLLAHRRTISHGNEIGNENVIAYGPACNASADRADFIPGISVKSQLDRIRSVTDRYRQGDEPVAVDKTDEHGWNGPRNGPGQAAVAGNTATGSGIRATKLP